MLSVCLSGSTSRPKKESPGGYYVSSHRLTLASQASFPP